MDKKRKQHTTDEIEEPKTTYNRISTPHPTRPNRPPSILVGSGVNKMISPLQNSGDSEEPVKRKKPYIPPGAVHMGGPPMGMPKGGDLMGDLNNALNKRASMRREPPTSISKVLVFFLTFSEKHTQG